MSTPELAPRGMIAGVVSVWGVALVASVVIGLVAPEEWRIPWITVALGGSLILAFAVQLWVGRSKGFIDRVAASVAGALVVMGLVSVVFGLVALIPG